MNRATLRGRCSSAASSAPDHGEFRRWLRETVGTFEKNLRDRSVLDALAEHQRRGALLATTNYDLKPVSKSPQSANPGRAWPSRATRALDRAAVRE